MIRIDDVNRHILKRLQGPLSRMQGWPKVRVASIVPGTGKETRERPVHPVDLHDAQALAL